MCLGIPGLITSRFLDNGVLMASVDFNGISKKICLEHVPEAETGDYVVVHVGFALSRLNADEAARVFQLLDELGQLDELEGDTPCAT